MPLVVVIGPSLRTVDRSTNEINSVAEKLTWHQHAGQGRIQNKASAWHLLWAPAEAAPVTKQSLNTPCTFVFEFQRRYGELCFT